MFLAARGFRVAVTVGHRPALVFGGLRRLFGRRGVLHIAKEFFIEEADTPRTGWGGLLGRLKMALYRWALRDVDLMVVNARGECPAYARLFRLPPERVAFLPWPSNIDEPQWFREHDGSILAVGRSLRDWRTFFRAVDGLPHRVVVVASRADLAGLTAPANVTVLTDIPHAEYLRLVRRAMFVVLPLVATPRSTGQATFLECMACGKPVLVTEVVGSVDYIRHGENGLLCPPADPDALRREAVRLAEEPALRERLARGGLRSIRERFNKSRYARDMLELIERQRGHCGRPGGTG
jgi:glycosyltransferase involved in cell wall biosynthesis